MKQLFDKFERLKSIRAIKTMVTLTFISFLSLVWYVSGLPLSVGQKSIILTLTGVLLLLALITEDHIDKQTYLDELRSLSEKLGEDK